VLRKPFDRLGGLREEGASLGVQKINGAFAQRGRKVRFAKDIGGLFNFDRFSPATQAKIRAYQDSFIAGLETDARDVIEAVVLDGLRAGMTPDQLADDIRAVIGLTDRQAKAALNYRRMLYDLDPAALQRQLTNLADDAVLQAAIVEGKALEQAAIDAMFTNYIDNSLDYRAATIAQTESVRAASAGLQDAYDQAVDRGALTYESITQHWQIALDEKTCPTCRSIPAMISPVLNPDGVALGEMFDSEDGPMEGAAAKAFRRSVSAYRLLRDGYDPAPEQHGPQIALGLRHVQMAAHCGSRLLLTLLLASRAAAYRVMGILSEGFSFLCGRPGHAPQHAFTAIGGRNPGLFETSDDNWPTDAKIARDALHRSAGIDLMHNGDEVDRPAASGYFLFAREPAGLKPSAENFLADVELARNILEGNIIPVKRDYIVSVCRVPFGGHVYNLETEQGFYEANGIITHNCRCSLEMVTDLDKLPGYEEAA
jgi:hypothetical protein